MTSGMMPTTRQSKHAFAYNQLYHHIVTLLELQTLNDREHEATKHQILTQDLHAPVFDRLSVAVSNLVSYDDYGHLTTIFVIILEKVKSY